MKISAMIQARMGSSRLPGKILKKIYKEKTLLEVVIQQLSFAKKIDEIIVLTTTLSPDVPVVNLCQKLGVPVFTGSVEDVLDRYYQAALAYKPNHIVRITADCPLIDPQLVDHVVDQHIKNGNIYTSNRIEATWPDGLDTEIFTFRGLRMLHLEAQKKSDREHVTPYFYNNPNRFKIENVACTKDYAHMRWTVDEPEDLDFIREIYKVLGRDNDFIRSNEVIQFLQKNPDLHNINAGIIRDEGYINSLKEES